MKIIGVTGTNGKTSTTQFLYDMLSGIGRKTAICGTLGLRYDGEYFDIELTTPAKGILEYHMDRMRRKNVEYLIMEVSSHALVQNRVDGINFDVGVFTNLTQDHLDYHGTFENYKNAKRKILDISDAMVMNVDDETGEEFFREFTGKGRKCLNISTKCTCTDISAASIESSLYGTDFLLDLLGTQTHVKIPIPGEFTAYNVMSAMGAMSLLGFAFDEIISSVESITPVKGRAQILNLDADFNVMIDFAHTPDALMNILSTVRAFFDGRLVTLFGCGGDRDKTKRPIMGEIVAGYSDYIYVTSDNPRTEDPMKIITDILPPICESGKPYKVIENREEAITYAVQSALPGDLLILAGKGHEAYQIIGSKKLPFDEEKIVRKALQF